MNGEDYLEFDLDNPGHCEDVRRAYLFEVQASPQGNRLFVHRNSQVRGGALRFGGERNIIVLEENCRVQAELVCVGSGAQVRIGGGPHDVFLQLTLYEDAEFVLGSEPTIYGMRAWISDRAKIVIGDDCLISEGVTIRTTDHHTIFDLQSLKQMNWPGDVHIGDHVWLGQDVAITKRVTIGKGAIIGAKSLISRDIPSFELWAGAPARPLRQGVSWLREHPARESQMLACRERLLE